MSAIGRAGCGKPTAQTLSEVLCRCSHESFRRINDIAASPSGSAVHPSVTTVNVKEPLMAANTVLWIRNSLHPPHELRISARRPTR
jgi:hypothetical protein